MRNSRLTHNGKGLMEQNGVCDGSIYEWLVPAIVNHDGESHRRSRSLANRAFAPRMIEGLRPLIRRGAQSPTEEPVTAGEYEFAARVTTRLQPANAVIAFSGYPDQWRPSGDWPEPANQIIEEAMRWPPSCDAVHRFAGEDFEFRGESADAGTLLMIGVQAAQRDPRAYPGGEVFDITAAHKPPILRFGGGPHHRLGAPPARLEFAGALSAPAGWLEPPVASGPFSWRPAIGIHGPNELPPRSG